MTNQEAIRILESMKDELILAFDHDRKEALKLAISALQAQYSIRICDTCKHDPPEMDKWPCMDCDMRDPADRWETKDIPDINVGDMISRQAAIEAAIKAADDWDGGYNITRANMIEKELNDLPSAQPELCEDAVSRNAIIRTLNTMDRYVSEELTLCDTDEKYPKNEVFIVDDVYEEIVEKLPSAQPEPSTEIQEILEYLDTTLHPIVSPDNWNVYSELHDMVSRLPSAQPERKTGKWIPHKSIFGGLDEPVYTCDKCGHNIGFHAENFCPNCGAKMEGEG